MSKFDLLSPAVWAAYAGGLLSGLFAVVGMVVTSRNERLRREETARREDVMWFREEIAKAYSQALYYLFKLSISSLTETRTDKDVRQQLSESQRYLMLLHAYQPDQVKRAALMTHVKELDDEKADLSKSAASAGATVRTQFQADVRINVIR